MNVTRSLSRLIINQRVRSLRFCSASSEERELIGCREVVGHGFNGQRVYVDRQDFPFPAIRFLADNPYLQALREKEKGDWRSLSIDDKKCLYRSSFCQTFAEMGAPTGEWKSITGLTLAFLSIAVWYLMFLKMFVAPRELPPTFSLERRQAQLQRMIDIGVNPVEGLASKWDYDNNDWK